MAGKYSEYVRYMKALADETRLKIYMMLAQGELCACKILEEFNFTQPTLSYHMKVLCDSGLVQGRRDGVWMKYSLTLEKLEEIQALFVEIGTQNKVGQKEPSPLSQEEGEHASS
ncbi:MAG: metalloregulator ArsR/SmtB family transcription factor [Eubacteriales bacterium]|nr:metalloregulator ArsR/SmtB family transcription factor [Eubacteriales bacterium]